MRFYLVPALALCVYSMNTYWIHSPRSVNLRALHLKIKQESNPIPSDRRTMNTHLIELWLDREKGSQECYMKLKLLIPTEEKFVTLHIYRSVRVYPSACRSRWVNIQWHRCSTSLRKRAARRRNEIAAARDGARRRRERELKLGFRDSRKSNVCPATAKSDKEITWCGKYFINSVFALFVSLNICTSYLITEVWMCSTSKRNIFENVKEQSG